MKKSIFGIIACLVLLCQGLFANGNEITLGGYENMDRGAEVPEWFIKIHGKNLKSSDFKEIIPDYDNKQIFVFNQKGPYLPFLETWGEVVFAEIEIASKMQHIISDIVSDYGIFDSSINLDEVRDYYYASISNIELVGLKQVESFWGRFDEKDANGNIVDSYYEYWLVYNMDKEMWNAQISNAIDNVPVGNSRIKKYIKKSVEDIFCSGRPIN